MDNKIIEDIAKKLHMSVEDVKKHCKEVPEIDGYYFWQPFRGGISIIINNVGEKLCATSSISFEKHLKAFKEGKRN